MFTPARRVALPLVSLPILALLFAGGRLPASSHVDVPREVKALEGTYTGSWSMRGLNAEGQVVQLAAWTDEMVASGAATDGEPNPPPSVEVD